MLTQSCSCVWQDWQTHFCLGFPRHPWLRELLMPDELRCLWSHPTNQPHALGWIPYHTSACPPSAFYWPWCDAATVSAFWSLKLSLVISNIWSIWQDTIGGRQPGCTSTTILNNLAHICKESHTAEYYFSVKTTFLPLTCLWREEYFSKSDGMKCILVIFFT